MKIAVFVILLVSQVALSAKPNYTYHVKIEDPAEANYQEKQETRVLENAQGFYSVLEPNGALRTVTYTADAEGFKPVITYSYGHPVAPVKKVVAPAKVLAPAVVQQPQQIVQVQQVAAVAPPRIQPVVARPALVRGPTVVVASPPAPVIKQQVPVSGGYAYPAPAKVFSPPIKEVSGGYSYPVPVAPVAAPVKTYLPPVAVAAPVKTYLPPVAPAVVKAPVPAYLPPPRAVVAAAPYPVAPVQKAVIQPGGYSYGISSADHYGLSYGNPSFSYHATRTYSHPPVYAPAPVAQKVAVAAQPVVQRFVQRPAPVVQTFHTVQPTRVAFAAPRPLVAPAPAQVAYAQAVPQQIPQIAYGAPQFAAGPSISYAPQQVSYPPQQVSYAPQQFSYAPQHVSYAPAPAVVRQVPLARPQVSLASLQQAQVNYVPQQVAAAPVYRQQIVQTSYPQAAVAPAPVAALPAVKQVFSAGNGLRISGNALAVPAASGAKNPLTFEYSYGNGAAQVSHSYSGSGW